MGSPHIHCCSWDLIVVRPLSYLQQYLSPLSSTFNMFSNQLSFESTIMTREVKVVSNGDIFDICFSWANIIKIKMFYFLYKIGQKSFKILAPLLCWIESAQGIRSCNLFFWKSQRKRSSVSVLSLLLSLFAKRHNHLLWREHPPPIGEIGMWMDESKVYFKRQTFAKSSEVGPLD